MLRSRASILVVSSFLTLSSLLTLATLAACGGPDKDARAPAPTMDDDAQDAGPPARVRFLGNVRVAKAALTEVVFFGTPRAQGQPVGDTVQQDLLRIQGLYFDQGFLDAKVEVGSMPREGDGDGATLVVRIKEGPRYTLGRLTATEVGTTTPAVGPLAPRVTLRPGDFLSRPDVARVVESLRLAYQDLGYVLASVSPYSELHPAEGVIDIDFRVERHELATWGEVAVYGNHTVPAETLRKAFLFAEGEPFSETKLKRTVDSIADLFNPRANVSFSRWLSPDQKHVLVTFDIGAPVAEARTLAPCTAGIDVAALLTKHEASFGSFAAVQAALPHTMTGYIATKDRSGDATITLDATRLRVDLLMGGVDPFRPLRLPLGAGIDDRGAWGLSVSGALVRVEKEMAPGATELGYLLRREYLAADARAAATAECRQVGEARETWLTFPGKSKGAAHRLALDPANGEVIAYELVRHGETVRANVSAWSEPQASVRWPARMWLSGAPIDNEIVVREQRAGLSCGARDCLSAPPPRMTATWPASGVVTVPFTFFADQIFVRARAQGRPVLALLDSGASMTTLDATSGVGAELTPALAISVRGSTQLVTDGIAEAASVSVGDLSFSQMPVAAVPLGVLAQGGALRAEMILGYAFFASAAVRVDYARQELTFAKDAKKLPPRAGVVMKVDATWDMLTANANVAGSTGQFQLDTGSGNGVNLDEAWAKEHKLPGALPFVEASALTGAGEKVTTLEEFRVPKVTLGPIHYDKRIVDLNVNAPRSGLAGLIGNDLFARCDALTFDPEAHTVTFHGACNRPRPESRMGWHLVRNDDAANSDTPWVVDALLPGSSAEVSGIAKGDRLLRVGGKPATIDLQSWIGASYGAEGERVEVVVKRGEARRTVVVTLRTLLPLGRANPERAVNEP